MIAARSVRYEPGAGPGEVGCGGLGPTAAPRQDPLRRPRTGSWTSLPICHDPANLPRRRSRVRLRCRRSRLAEAKERGQPDGVDARSLALHDRDGADPRHGSRRALLNIRVPSLARRAAPAPPKSPIVTIDPSASAAWPRSLSRTPQCWRLLPAPAMPVSSRAVYRFRTRCRICELRFGAVGGLGQDRGLCLSVCCTWSRSGSLAGWSCWAAARHLRTRRGCSCLLRSLPIVQLARPPVHASPARDDAPAPRFA